MVAGMARILLIGGHGKIALLAEPLLVKAGHEVDAVIRNPEQADAVRATGANPVVADVSTLDVAGTVDLVDGHDVVVWSAGAGGGDAARTYAVDRDAAIRAIDATAQTDARRFVMVSYFGAGPDHEVPEDDGFYPYAEAKAAADAHLRDSPLDWVVLMPSSLTDDPGAGTISVHDDEATHVARADVAQVLAAAVDADLVDVDVPFNAGRTPIAQALADLDES